MISQLYLFEPQLLNEMENRAIDEFFNSFTNDELMNTWKKYDKYSENENNIKISELLNNWNQYYDNTFILEDNIVVESCKITVEKSEQCFGFFFKLHLN